MLTCYRANDRVILWPFDRLRELGASLRGAAAVIGRVGERNRRFVGERRRDRLRHNKPYFSCSLSAMVLLVRWGDLTTDWSGVVCRRSLGAETRWSGRELSGREGLDTLDEAEDASFAEVKTPMERPQRRMAAA